MTVHELSEAFEQAIKSNDYSDDIQVLFCDGDKRKEIVGAEYWQNLGSGMGAVYLIGRRMDDKAREGRLSENI